jgi:hypothetical protein
VKAEEGPAPDPQRVVGVQLGALGSSVRARRIRLRGEDAWVAFLPDAAVGGLRSGRRAVPLTLPPASAQCGYSIGRRF